MIRVKAVYENNMLKPLEKLDLKEGEEVEIELKRKGEKKRDILSYAGLLNDLSEEEERLFHEAVKRRNIFGRTLNL
jgi:predicted DNA-binding antitoxin AbrB/MazE fold protein